MIKVQEPTENEVKVWCFTVGNLPRIMLFARKSVKEAVKLIREQEGFIGFYINRPEGTLCLFDSENNAKSARKVRKFRGAYVGTIFDAYIDKSYMRGKNL